MKLQNYFNKINSEAFLYKIVLFKFFVYFFVIIFHK